MTFNNGSNEPLGPLPRRQSALLTIVPTDIWREIFKISRAEANLSHSKFSERNNRTVPRALPLCQVCSYWRNIANSSPEIWNQIYVYIDREGKISPPLQLLRLILDHAGGLPLKISLGSSSYFITTRPHPSSLNTARLIVQSFHRADDIEVHANFFTLLPKILDNFEDIVPTGTPLLKNLVCRMELGGSNFNPGICKIWMLAPNLRSLVLNKSITSDRSSAIYDLYIPCGRLTRLIVDCPIVATGLLVLLSDLKNLIECIIDHMTWGNNDPEYQKPIILPALQLLSIQGPSQNSQNLSFLACLRTPALNTLYLDGRGDSWSHDDFAFFLTNSSCSIRHFGFSIPKVMSAEKLESLRLLLRLTCLTIRPRRNDSESDEESNWVEPQSKGLQTLIDKLDEWDKSGNEFSFLPQLREIRIDHNILPDPIFSPSFARMVKDRRVKVKIIRTTKRHRNYVVWPSNWYEWVIWWLLTWGLVQVFIVIHDRCQVVGLFRFKC